MSEKQVNNDDLTRIWHEAEYAEMQAELLRLMINFQLAYEIPGRRGEYIAPQLLPVEKPVYQWDEAQNLILRFTYKFMPKGILTRFIVAVHQYIEADKVWRSGVILAKDGTRAEVIEHYTQSPEITVRVVGNNKRGLLEIIMDNLDRIHASFKRLQVDKLVPCNCEQCQGSQNPHTYTFEALKVRLLHQKYDIECERPPFEKVNVLHLIDDIIDFQKLLEQDSELRELRQGKDDSHIYINQFISERTDMSSFNVSAGRDLKADDIVGGDKVGRDKAGGDIVYGDKVGGDKYVELQDALKQWQEQVIAKIEAREDLAEDEKGEMKEAVTENAEKVMAEAKGEARPGRIERLLNTVSAMGDDILEVTVATLVNPMAGVGLVLKKINDRIKLEGAKEAKQDSAA